MDKSLDTAAYQGDRERVEELLRAGVDVNAKGGTYGTALQAASISGQKEIVGILLAAGALPDAQGLYDENAILTAASYGNKEVVEILSDVRADPNIQDKGGKTALCEAAYFGHQEIVEVLIAAGADVNLRHDDLPTALQVAAEHGYKGIVEILLKAGADVNADGGGSGATALHRATLRGYAAIARLLCEAGADTHAQSVIGGTALQIAATNGDEDIVLMLLEQDGSAAMDLQDRDMSSSLHTAAMSGNIEILDSLLQHGADQLLDVKNSSGQTAFHIAAANPNLEVSQKLYALIEDKASALEDKDIDGQTPLHLAVENENIETIQWLLEQGADADTPDFGDTSPFQRAADTENFPIMCQLYSTLSGTNSLVSASRWRFISRVSRGIVEMATGDSTEVMVWSEEEFEQYIVDRAYSLAYQTKEILARNASMAEDEDHKRIFLLPDGGLLGKPSALGFRRKWWRKTLITNPEPWARNIRPLLRWVVKSHDVPSGIVLESVKSGECFLECRITLPNLSLREFQQVSGNLSDALNALNREHCIVWILIKPETLTAEQAAKRRLLKSTIFFSTLEHAAVPRNVCDLCGPLIEQLVEEWTGICHAAERHLNERREQVLSSEGVAPGLIKVLLNDARLWGRLRELMEAQAGILIESFEVKSREMLYEEDRPEVFQGFIQTVKMHAERLRTRLNGLNTTSQELIQLEFNLTSIAEAQKSTTMNRSMKRLSWITFIFLPLMFIASLFGMNVNALENNPEWWWYLPFAFGVVGLTLSVWIIFKRSENLENRIEEKLSWLLKGNKPKPQDEEQGYQEDTASIWSTKSKLS